MKWLNVLTKQKEIGLLVFLILSYIVPVKPSMITFETSSNFMILISFISSFEINRRNLLPALIAIPLFHLLFFFKFIYCIREIISGKLSQGNESPISINGKEKIGIKKLIQRRKEKCQEPSSSPAHLFAIRGRRKRGPGTLQTRDQNLPK